MLHVPPRYDGILTLLLCEAACALATTLCLGGYQSVQPSSREHRDYECHADADKRVAEQDEYATDDTSVSDACHKTGIASGGEDDVGRS